jgi:predicted GIY-YIG superfamily endonuclease
MPERQLTLFPSRNSLCERFPPEFFRSIPRVPGVYLMSDAQGRILYVGKARDLRERLGSYRYVHAHASRKAARLTARVTTIRWQVCATEEEALLEENRLLRELRPRFNRANTWPKTARFVHVDCPGTESLELRLAEQPDRECYGAFKGASRQSFGAFLRLLWTDANGASYGDLPRALLADRPGAVCRLPMARPREWRERLHGFFLGEHDEWLRELASGAGRESIRFHDEFRHADLLSLEQFFRTGPQRNRVLRELFGSGSDLIAQELLDDWIVRWRRTAPPARKSPGL